MGRSRSEDQVRARPQARTSRLANSDVDITGGVGDTRSDAQHTRARRRQAVLKRILLPLYSVCLLLTATANSVTFKKMTNAMPNYPFFLMQVSIFVYVPTMFLLVGALRLMKLINAETLRFPKSRFATMALFDAISGVFTLFGGVFTKGTTQMLLLQGAIPITMLCSFLLLRTRYEWMQYVGAAVIISGVFVVLSPKLFPSSSAVAASDAGSDVLLFNSLFFLANVPQSLSSVYKEVAFKDSKNLDVYYTQYYIALFQLVMGFFVLPLNSLPFLDKLYVPLRQLPYALRNGAKCAFGVNTIVTHCSVGEGAWMSIVQYMFFNFQYNIFCILLIREGSAALLIVIMTLRLPLGNMAFYSSLVMGDAAQPFDSHDISGLVVILIGLVIYRYQRSPESPDAAAPLVITSIVTVGPGVSEPITSQVQRRPIEMKRRVDAIRGGMYTRLGLPPSPMYKSPASDSTRSIDEEDSTPVAEVHPPRRQSLPLRDHGVDSPLIGVSPVARSAPFYHSLRKHDSKQESESASSDDDDDDDDEDSARGDDDVAKPTRQRRSVV